MTKGSDLLVAALENEGVERIFGIPGEDRRRSGHDPSTRVEASLGSRTRIAAAAIRESSSSCLFGLHADGQRRTLNVV
jgi:hypothetical protein